MASHGGEWCGLSVAERAALVAIERAVADGDPGFALRLADARGARVRSWLLSTGGTAAGAGLLAVGVGGVTFSGWFFLLVCLGSVPAVADVAETRRVHRLSAPLASRTDQST